MPNTTNDMLSTLQLFGDYLRAGKHPAPEHYVMRKLASDIPNQKVFTLFIQEGHKRLEMMLGMYSVDLRNRKIPDPYEDHREILPEYDRMHSVLHGMFTWFRMNPGYDRSLGVRIEQLGNLDMRLLRQFDLGGLTSDVADDILVTAGRELIDTHILCVSSLLHEFRQPEFANPTAKIDQVPFCLLAS